MNIVIVGGGGLHGLYCLDILMKSTHHNIVGICDSKLEPGSKIYGYDVIGRQERLGELAEEYKIDGCVISLGDNYERQAVYRQLSAMLPSLRFVNAIHPTVVLGENVSIGEGVVIGPGSIIGAGTFVGDFVSIGSSVVLGVNNHLGSFSSLSNGVVTGGLTRMKEFAAAAPGAILLDRLCVGSNTVVGSGSMVMADLPDNVLAYGSPAKVIRSRTAGERFLR
jgi:sugar O-acyltransferase (sialic acid O-acetyltransferase NeuD family)